MASVTTTSQKPEDKRLELRQAFGNFATGVTIITTVTASGKPIGFTANSFTSVSLDPPLLLACLAKTSSNLEHFIAADAFAVNILEEDQKDVSGRFALPIEDRFADTIWHPSNSGTPLIDGTVGWFDCKRQDVIDAGDHIILIGHVQDFGQNDKRPLAYLRGRYLEIGLGETAAEAMSQNVGVRVGCVLEYMDQVLLQDTPDGWTLPMGDSRAGFREGRISLDMLLSSAGVTAELGFLYSVFEAPSGNSTWLVFQGEAELGAEPKGMKFFPINELPLDEIPTTQIQALLRRFQIEHAEARFGLYVDDATSAGRITPIEKQSTSWDKFLKQQQVKQ